ncbi:hypothetical protein [Streptomyces sp. LN245]|uniref:hypothetical protein n=1 Tax=Streptomyces sp. LN245 TaxID=3112975 RepID=UPI0037174B8C
MTVLRWWFVDVPEWGWHLMGPHWKSWGGLVLLALLALAYVVVTLTVLAGMYRVGARLARNVGRGVIQGARNSRAKDESS